MYFPYLRGRQFELIALRELLDKGLINEHLPQKFMGIEYNSTLCKDGYNLAIFEPELFECIETRVYQVQSLEYNTNEI